MICDTTTPTSSNNNDSGHKKKGVSSSLPRRESQKQWYQRILPPGFETSESLSLLRSQPQPIKKTDLKKNTTTKTWETTLGEWASSLCDMLSAPPPGMILATNKGNNNSHFHSAKLFPPAIAAKVNDEIRSKVQQRLEESNFFLSNDEDDNDNKEENTAAATIAKESSSNNEDDDEDEEENSTTTTESSLDNTDYDLTNNNSKDEVTSTFSTKNTTLSKTPPVTASGRLIPSLCHDDFEIGSILGTGNFCDVRKIRITNEDVGLVTIPSSKKLVVKQLRPSLLSNQKEFIDAAADLIVEAKYLLQFQHDHIISIHGTIHNNSSEGQQEDNYYLNGRHDAFGILLDEMDCTLYDRMFEWRKEDDESATIEQMVLTTRTNDTTTPDDFFLILRLELVHQIASALEYLHRNNWVYRDLKPGNVGLIKVVSTETNFYYKVKLLDFGLIARMNGETFLKQRCGTLRYMAPEVCMGRYDARADVYSLTVLMWELLTLGRDYMERCETNNLEHVKAILHGQREEYTTGNINDLLQKGWNGNLDERLTMEQFRTELEEIIESVKNQ